MIELLWDAAARGTARTSLGTVGIGDPSGHDPGELLETAVAGCMMHALLNAASAARIPILGYVSSARLEEHPSTAPRIRLRGCVVGPATVSEKVLSRLADEARYASPIAQVLGDRLDVTWDLRLLVDPVELTS
jgi:uncharacterized OsmC-like protein